MATVLRYCGPELQVFVTELRLMLSHQERLMDAGSDDVFPKIQILSCLQGAARARCMSGEYLPGFVGFWEGLA